VRPEAAKIAANGGTVADEALLAYTDRIFAHLVRSDQKRWAYAYVRSLLTVPGKKTLQALAEAAGLGPGALGGLRQFINASPWDWQPARRVLADLAISQGGAQAWTIGTVVIPKRGDHSVGVHRRFVPEIGRTVNCQLAYGLYLSSAHHSVPVDWQLSLDSSWLGDALRRRRARIPEQLAPRSGPWHPIDLAGSIVESSAAPHLPLVADLTRVSDIAPLVLPLARRGVGLMVRIAGTQRFELPSGATRTAAEILASSARQCHVVTAIDIGSRTYRVAASSAPARLPGGDGAAGPVFRLLSAKGVPTAIESARYWLTTALDTRVSDVLSLVRHLNRTEMVGRVLEDHYGVLDFEGRSFPGWHHHMTMVSAAYAYAGLRRQPAARAGGVFADHPAPVPQPLG